MRLSEMRLPEKKKGKKIADLAALVVEPIGYIVWRDGVEHNVRNPVDVDWPDHLRLMHVEESLEAALENAPANQTEAEKLRDQLVSTVEGLKGLLAPLIPSVTAEQWAMCPAVDVFVMAKAVKVALAETRADQDPTRTSQTKTTTMTK